MESMSVCFQTNDNVLWQDMTLTVDPEKQVLGTLAVITFAFFNEIMHTSWIDVYYDGSSAFCYFQDLDLPRRINILLLPNKCYVYSLKCLLRTRRALNERILHRINVLLLPNRYYVLWRNTTLTDHPEKTNTGDYGSYHLCFFLTKVCHYAWKW